MKYLFFTLVFIFTAFNIFPEGIRERVNTNTVNPSENMPVSGDEENIAKITGRVVIYGNEPFTYVGIVDQNGIVYSVYPADKEAELRSFQGHLIEFIVIFLEEPRGYGSLFLIGKTVTPVSWIILR